ncbi:MAG: DUF262 domain-containing HNH endonuclease family protein [Planctomycetales bacterium]|nr:DUF262 domain-containing HNH endonuclease family protein [Planctomycetales bacterium]
MSHIQPQYQVLDDLLQKRLFRIPDYQRAYSWERRQRNELFSDINKLIEKNDDRHHFMATIVCLKTPDKAEVGTKEFQYLDVVDGQQRLTTLILLLRAIARKLAKGNESDVEESKELEKLLVKGDERIILLQTNHDSSLIFSNYLRNGTLPKTSDVHSHADERLANGISDCEHFVQHADIIALLKIIKNRLGFIFYELQHESAVYTVFEVLNSRGLEVDALDKCKSILMGVAFEHLKDDKGAARDFIDELHGHWKGIYKVIGTTDVSGSEILRFGATLWEAEERAKTHSNDEALDYFREQGELAAKKTSDISQWLLYVTTHLVPIYRNTRLAAVTEITQARLLLLALLMTDSLDEEQRKKAVRQWENVTFRTYALSLNDSRTAVGDFNRLAQRISGKYESANTYPRIMKELRSLGSKYPVSHAISEFMARENAYEGWEEQLRYFLYRYERDLAERDGTTISQELWDQIWSKSAAQSIEHICPQEWSTNWGDMSAWFSKFYAVQHLIGNLILLPPGLNSSVGQQSFKDKKEKYKKNYLRMMNDVVEYEDWTPETIKQRTKILLDWAQKAFDDIPD